MASIFDAASDIFDKGKQAAADIASSAGTLANKGKIKAQMADADLEYNSLMKRLGMAVYDEIKLDEKYTQAHEDLFAQIAAALERKQALEEELAAADAASDEAFDTAQDDAAQPEVVQAEIIEPASGSVSNKAEEVLNDIAQDTAAQPQAGDAAATADEPAASAEDAAPAADGEETRA